MKGQRAASCFSHATAGDFSEDPREQNLNVSSACMFGLSRHPFSRVCHHSNPAIKARLSHLQTVIDGQESRRALDNMSKLHRSRLDTSFCTRRSGSSQLASDETLSRTACTGKELHCKPTRSVDQLCEMCPSPTLHSSTNCSNDVSVDPVIGFSAGAL